MIIPRYRDIFNHYADFSSDNHKSFGQDNNIKRRVIAMKKRDKSRFPQASDGTKHIFCELMMQLMIWR